MVAAKAPVPGAVKTRLCPPLSPDEAARLARALLADTLETARAPAVSGVADVFLALDGQDDSLAAFPRRFSQRGGHLGERLAHLFADAFAEGYAHVCIIGGDAPHFPAAFLIEAFGRLAPGGDDAVALGHAQHVVYTLVGL